MTLLNTRTNIVLDDSLIERAMLKANVHTKREAVDAALKAFVREPNWSFALSLRGSNLVAADYDPEDAAKTIRTIATPHPRPRARVKRKTALA